jgi:hypothetical protein
MLPARARTYLLVSLEGTPTVLEQLLSRIAPADPLWDLRPDPERFTLREMLAHIADWEPIYYARLSRTLNEEVPFLSDVDEGALVVKNNYASKSPQESLARFREGRAKLLVFLHDLPSDAWSRHGNREFLGIMTLEDQVALIVGHDGYHTRQTAEMLTAS